MPSKLICSRLTYSNRLQSQSRQITTRDTALHQDPKVRQEVRARSMLEPMSYSTPSGAGASSRHLQRQAGPFTTRPLHPESPLPPVRMPWPSPSQPPAAVARHATTRPLSAASANPPSWKAVDVNLKTQKLKDSATKILNMLRAHEVAAGARWATDSPELSLYEKLGQMLAQELPDAREQRDSFVKWPLRVSNVLKFCSDQKYQRRSGGAPEDMWCFAHVGTLSSWAIY